ncbi:MAG TPA: DUF4157 domain-containing protein [Kofleriaceae bacterium]|nr:DUF4157 domain-containing protein [Kofleriaceae bacterium]
MQKSASSGEVPGKRTLVGQLPGPVQRHAAAGAAATATEQVHAAAAQGVATPSSSLPHAAAIQRSFGRHDISSVQAHTDGAAAASAQAMGAQAYATGNHVVLGTSDLHTEAHEAAHVVQQRGGVQLKGGVGEVGDSYERHADEVADAVVQGKSAEGLLDRYAGGAQGGGGGAAGAAVQGHFTITRADFEKQQVNHANDPRFSAQEPSADGSYLRQDGTTNIVAQTIAAIGGLRVSGDGRLAIEERGGGDRQAKTFFIEEGLIAGANADLVKVKSLFRLVPQGGSITVPDAQAQLHTLVQVVAQNVKNESQGDDVTGSVNCDEMAAQVGGWGADFNKIARLNEPAPDWANEEGHRVAAYIVEYAKSPSLMDRLTRKSKAERASNASNYSLPAGNTPAEILVGLAPQRDKIAAAYGQMSADDKRKVAAALGLNESADPKVGEALVTFSTGSKSKDGLVRDHERGQDVAARWGQHWGGVVAKSGGDYITFENYDRKSEDEGRGNAPGPAAETRGFFQMYGAASGQTWHEIQKGTGEFPNAVSLVYGNKKAEK